MKSYRQLVYGRKTLQENFEACVQQMEAAGLTDDEMEEMTSDILIPEIAKTFAEAYQGTAQLYSPEDALVEFCLSEGISESLYDAIAEFIGEATSSDEDNLTTDWTKLSRAEHIAAVKRFLKKLAKAGSDFRDNKTFLPSKQDESPAKRLSPERKEKLGEETENSHKNHPLHSLLNGHGYEHYRSYPIKQADASLKNYHIWANKFSNLVGAYDGERKWTSKINKNSGHQVTGVGKEQLDNHLKNRAARNKNLPEQQSLPSNPLQEGLQNPYGKEKVKKYSEWMKRNPYRNLGHDVASNDVAFRKSDLITARRLRAEQDRTFGFDEATTDYRAASLAQLNERKKK